MYINSGFLVFIALRSLSILNAHYSPYTNTTHGKQDTMSVQADEDFSNYMENLAAVELERQKEQAMIDAHEVCVCCQMAMQ